MERTIIIFLALLFALLPATAQDEGGSEEINPSEYVPLAVGNSWTYEHFYWNNSYDTTFGWDIEDIERPKPFTDIEVPGYPHGEGNALPPDSLLLVERILTIEITHTERIDGREYFVFSDADYDWPPLPDFFWAGKKVRLSDEGALVFRWNGQEVSIYDFGELQNGDTVTLPGESAIPFDFDPHVNFYEAPKTSNQHSLVHFHAITERGVNSYCHFNGGYGMGLFVINSFGLGPVPIIENALTGLSANVYGKEIWYDQLDPYATPPPPEPPAVVWGQLAQLNRSSGFDFSAGTETDYYSEDGDVVLDQFPGVHGDTPNLPSFLCAHTCIGLPPAKIVDLGRVDFGRLVSEGGGTDLQLVQSQSQIFDPQAGHTYAIWTREGGIALMHALKIVLTSRRTGIDYIFFDWVYYPPAALSSDGSAVQPTSWGALKQSILRTK